LIEEAKVQQLSVKSKMKDTNTESFARRGSGLAGKIAILMNELSDVKQELTQSQKSVVELKTRIQKLQYLVHTLEQ
jgi:3-methyladenine DNA glycosylase AlkD